MTVDRKKQKQLGRLLDGELSRKQAIKLRDEVKDDPELQRELGQFSQLGDLLRSSLDEPSASASFDGVWRNIERELRQERPMSIWARVALILREHFTVHRNSWVASVATALLVCAIVIPLMLGRNVPSGSPDRTAPISNEMHVETWESETGEVIVWKANRKSSKQEDDIPVIVHQIDNDDDQPLPPEKKDPKAKN